MRKRLLRIAARDCSVCMWPRCARVTILRRPESAEGCEPGCAWFDSIQGCEHGSGASGADRKTTAIASRAVNPAPERPAGRAPGPAARIFAQRPRAPVPAARTLISRTWFRILGHWLRGVMSCPVAGRGHRRSWSWPGTAPRTCCAGSSMSGTDRGTPGCPGSSPPGIRSGTATTWSASAPVRCSPWRTRARTRGCRVGCSAATGRSVRGPWPHPAHQALMIPGTSPGHDDRPGGGLSC